MSDITLTADQDAAVTAARDWFKSGDQQVFRLFGHAGVGKTTLAKYIVNSLNLDAGKDVHYAAFTGKAAYRLRQAGCIGATTIHKLIYIPLMKARTRLDELLVERSKETDPAKKAELDRKIVEEEKVLAEPGFTLNIESPLNEAKLVVIDEVSMVGEKMARDLLSFGCKVLVLGDPAQLPPVKGTGYFIDAVPEVLLTEPMRFGGLSSVIEVATKVRHGEPVAQMYTGSDGGPVSGRWTKPLTAEQAMRFDVILCWRNDTRWRITRLLRKARGFDGDAPNIGERIIMLANNYDLNVYNGQELVVSSVAARDGMLDVVARDELDDLLGGEYKMPVLTGGFEGKKQQENAERSARSRFKVGAGTGVATFAHAITGHKAQGSGWPKVAIVDETPALRAMRGDDEARKWLYTSVTRAERQCVIVPEIVGK